MFLQLKNNFDWMTVILPTVGKKQFLPPKTIFAGAVSSVQKTFFPPSGKILPPWWAGIWRWWRWWLCGRRQTQRTKWQNWWSSMALSTTATHYSRWMSPWSSQQPRSLVLLSTVLSARVGNYRLGQANWLSRVNRIPTQLDLSGHLQSRCQNCMLVENKLALSMLYCNF